MNTKNKIILHMIIVILVIGFLTTAVIATVSDLSKLTGSSEIGQSFILSYSQMRGSKNIYCIQKNKDFSGEKRYILKNYVEINGKEAKVYSDSGSNYNTVNDDLNAQVAYILNRKQGYGSHQEPTDTQRALWHVANSWTTKIFGNSNYSWEENANADKNTVNERAEEYAEMIGDQKASDETNTSAPKITVKDKTNKETISVMDIGGYDRVGPFRWEFGGILQSITVTGNKGVISDSNIRFVKYTGKTPNVVNVSDILTGEAFYVDISKSSGNTELKKLELKTSSSTSDEATTIYTAKIWFFQASSSQNLIYVDVGNSEENPSNGEGIGEYDITLTRDTSIDINLIKVDDRDENIPLTGVGFTFKTTIQTYDVVKSEDHYKNVGCTHIKTSEYTDSNNVYHPAVYEHSSDTVLDWTQYTYEWKDHTMYLNSDGTWGDSAKTYYTTNTGSISVNKVKYPTKDIENESYNGEKYTSTARIKEGAKIIATEVSNPYYGYTIGNEYEISINTTNKVASKKITNHQSLVKLSGYVWIDESDGKLTEINNEYDSNSESGFNGITVYLRDKNGNALKTTTTTELGLYSEINGGEYQFVDVDLDALQRGEYYVEFEYCGIDYQSVVQILDKNNGSKAIDTATRNVLDNKFLSVDSTGTQSLNINDVTVNYNDISEHVSTINSHTGCNVYARTNEAGYDLYSGFTPTSEEIRYVNLGLFKKNQTDYALAQDLYNVRVEVNGYSHIYRYGAVRFSNNGNTIDEDSSWNMGVKFQNNRGTYSRAIYNADAKYEAPNHRDNEIKVYVTYKVALKNESSYLARINSIVDYCDNRYELISAGTSIDNNDNVSGNLSFGQKTAYNNEYSKYIINVDSVIEQAETKYIYIQFEMTRDGILAVARDKDVSNDGKLLNNVAEINSYTTFKDNNVNKPVAVLDHDSVPGTTVPGQTNTYEDDTDAARSLQLELKNARSIVGTVFVDSTGKDSNTVYTNQERLGNGIFDNGETTIKDIKVKLRETGKDDSSYDGERVEMETTTDENGNFEFVGYIPGNYIITYTWGDKTYKVQYYKGTIYDKNRNQNDTYWYKDSVDIRKTDALDNLSIREIIDNEMEALKYNTLENEINKAYEEGSNYITQTTMDSSTPTMSFSVEYETTITDGIGDQVKFEIKNVDFGLVERPKQQLDFSKRVSGFKIILAKGEILVDAEITEDGRLKGTYNYVTYMKPSTSANGFVRAEMDNELIEGSTLEVTYTMKATNIGELDYVSKDYYLYGNSNGADKVKVSVTGLLDYVDRRLSVVDDKWNEKDKTFLDVVNASQKDNEDYLNSTRAYLTTKLSKELVPGESNTVELHTSKLLTSTDDNTFENQSEIVEVTKTPEFNTGTPVKVTWNIDKFNFNIDNAEEVIIIPNTGEDKSYALPIIIGMTSLLVLGVGVFGIRKFIIK